MDTGLTETVQIAGVDQATPQFARLQAGFRKRAVSPEHAAQAILRGVKRNRFWVYTSARHPVHPPAAATVSRRADVLAMRAMNVAANRALPQVGRAVRGRRMTGARDRARQSRRELGLPIWVFSRLAGRATRTAATGDLHYPRPRDADSLGLAALRRTAHARWPATSGRETELVILRVATIRACAYELEHQVRARSTCRASRPTTSTGCARARAAEGWRDHERLLMRVTRSCSPPATSTTRPGSGSGGVDERTWIECPLLVGHYDMLATTLTNCGLEPDPPRSRSRPGACARPRWR